MNIQRCDFDKNSRSFSGDIAATCFSSTTIADELPTATSHIPKVVL
ncbi:hypothetical protein C7S13_6081 [Burkholderia cepacia]|nr:hypothetical protein [Burkholderia cepacia]